MVNRSLSKLYNALFDAILWTLTGDIEYNEKMTNIAEAVDTLIALRGLVEKENPDTKRGG